MVVLLPILCSITGENFSFLFTWLISEGAYGAGHAQRICFERSNGGRAIKLSPGLASAYSYRGTALRRKRDFKSAIADLDQAIRLNPAIVEAYRNRDLARTGKDDPVEASAGFAP